MKVCINCKQEKSKTEFNPHISTKDHLTQWCKMCISLYNKVYRENNKEKIKQINAQYHIDNKEKIRERTKHWNEDNPEKKKALDQEYYLRTKVQQMKRYRERYTNEGLGDIVRARSLQWRKNNPGKVAAQLAKRRAAKKKATPPWVEFAQIEQLYVEAANITKETGVEHEVDHIIAFECKTACGLHCLANLRIITAEENNRKKCKLLED